MYKHSNIELKLRKTEYVTHKLKLIFSLTDSQVTR